MSPSLIVRRGLATVSLVLGACSDPAVVPDNPTPGIASITPSAVDVGVAGQVIVVAGSDFVAGSVVRADGADRPTQFITATELRASLPAADFVVAGTRQIVVSNPSPGGGVSNPTTLTVRQLALPVPTITALNPSFVEAGSGTQDITINGTGFSSQSQVLIGFTPKTATIQSATQLKFTLTSTEITTPGILTIAVSNPSPGGGVSNTVSFELRTPLPTLTGLSVTKSDAGQLSLTVGLTGTGFLETSVARFAGAPRPTRFLSRTGLEITLSAGDLRAAGSFPVTVENQAPGGGVSAALNLELVIGDPEILLLPSQGATAGSTGFSLSVHGRRFVAGSVVQWNGTDRPTTYLRADRLVFDIAAGDVAGPGVGNISVRNPSPGGGVSPGVPFTVRRLGASTSISRLMTLTTGDLVYDQGSAKIYASVAATSPTESNSVVAIDPITGVITGSTFVGSNPGRIARSDDGRFLYLGIDGANSVRRVAIPSLTAGLQWSVGAGLVAGDLEVLPHFPNAVAVSRQNPGSSPPLAGVTIYDDGVARPTSSPGHTGGNRIEFLESAAVLYGYNNAHTGFGFYEIAIDANGASHASETGGLVGGFSTDIVGAAGRVYGTDGSVVDAERLARVGTFTAQGNAIAVEPRTGRAFMLTSSGITVLDLNTFQTLGTIAIPPVDFDHPVRAVSRLVRWGQDGLAFFDLHQVFLIRSPLIQE